jgi:hypothetical protein
MPQKNLHKFHEQTSRLICDRRFRDMLEELETNPQARNAATGDPRAFVKERFPELPDEAIVECGEGNPRGGNERALSVWVRICAYGWCVTYTY